MSFFTLLDPKTIDDWCMLAAAAASGTCTLAISINIGVKEGGKTVSNIMVRIVIEQLELSPKKQINCIDAA